ncbi:S phase cyclin A-associated protein in the endoplasmic reticulum [Periophthalmus magnuspinnatus]|uniref:S phase cyclin A-associated protein in the endoplasmic reticulum n=1 Tax=Periophthalmus magnuspinnatus TaxID=409849 RepID=UPI0024374419|nr:S phase cyclin A-associated protein in the endoplasmic reticulum [Periophthalmus magnuspinnatus]
MSKDVRRRGAGQYRPGPRPSHGDTRDRSGLSHGDSRDRSGSTSSGSSHGGGRSKNSSMNALKASFTRSNSHDKVRKIVAEEGRAARNLIAWNVPLETKEEEAKSKNSSKTQRAGSGQQRSRKNVGVDSKSASVLLDKGVEKSPSKNRQPRKVDLRARYWAFLFENLRRAVDEIYVTCESDQSVVECREVLMMLDNYVRDFKALIDWIQLQEKLENTDSQNRPTSLAWEVRKMSPGRHVMASPSADRIVPSPGARRALNFGGPPPSLAAARLSHTGPSWADRVKCSQSLPHHGQTTVSQAEKPAKKDAEGWETVQRGRPAKPRSATMIAKVSPVVAQAPPKTEQTRAKAPHPQPQEPAAPQPQCQDPKPAEHDLEKEAPKSGDALEPQSMAEVLAKKEELADRLEKANEEAIASAIAEEEQLTREIQAENSKLETDNESDFSMSIGSVSGGANIEWSEMLADYDARETWRQSTSWGDMVEEEPARPPGHGIHMHEKLSSPSRKRTIAESKKKHEEKQLKAQQLRDKLREEKTLKLQKLLEREKDVRKWKEELLEQRRKMMEEKLLHAELKREVQLQAIVKKAQEEKDKVNEIAFINTLEAQNKRHDALAKLTEYEQRLNELQEERQRRQEEKQARDEAVQERKRVLEAERQARVEELLTKRKEQEARIEQQRQEKERAREDAARERARDREERLAALSAAQQEAMEELQKKIQMKHDESSRRHMEQMEQRKEKAAELSSGRHANTDYAPKLTPYERKKHCSLCSVLITSEVHLFSHTKGKRHQQAVRDSSSIQGRELSDEEVEHLSLKKYIVDIVTDGSVSSENTKDAEERQKARKKAKKLRARMNSRAKEYETSQEAKAQVPDSPYKAKLQRLVRDLLKQLQGQDTGQWSSSRVSALDRTLGEISRILEKQNNADQVAFQVGGGLLALEQILQVITAVSSPSAAPRVPVKSLCAAVNTYYLACASCPPTCSFVLFSNKITLLMDLLLHQLTLFVPDEDKSIFGRTVNKLVFEGLTTGLLQTISSILSTLWPPFNESGERVSSPDAKNKNSASDAFNTRTQDLISYVVNVGLIDKLYGVFLSVQSPVDDCPKMSSFLREASALLHNICKLCFVVTGRAASIFDNKRQDPCGLSSLLQSTDLVGVVHTLYSILLHTFPESSSHCQEPYSSGVIQVALNGIRFLNSFALLDLPAFQSILGAEGLSLAFRHVASSLLWYCSQHSSQALLHDVIICVGYFTVNHPDNQGMVQSGRQPSVLQRLCQLPFQYFSHPGLIRVLFPSLISACYNNTHNKVILQHEMSCVLLATFIQDCAANEKESDNKTKQAVPLVPDYGELSVRFPRDQWDSALKFFLQKEPS